MNAGRPERDLQASDDPTHAAGGGPIGVGHPTYAEVADCLLDNGYEPLPLIPNSKRPAPSRWTAGAIDDARVDAWSRSFGTGGVGLRTGALAAVDIDIDDPELAHEIAARAEALFGQTLVRAGRWPRRLLIFRAQMPSRKLSVPGVEILGCGQQFVAFGLHPATGRPYEWVTGETPCDVPFDQLPIIGTDAVQEFLAFAAAHGAPPLQQTHAGRSGRTDGIKERADHGAAPTRDSHGTVIDGRDGWLSAIAFHTVHDALDRHESLNPRVLAERVWKRFVATAETARLRQEGPTCWSRADALRKVQDKLRLQTSGRLPARSKPDLQPESLGALLDPVDARARLSHAIDAALTAARDWWTGDRETAPPAAGIRATVGLGKSALAREQVAAWQRTMKDRGLPHRVLVVTPSHALAEEASPQWESLVDGNVAVLRGYEGKVPASGAPMCRDIEMVKLALRESLSVGQSACHSSKTWRCTHHDGCLKLQNKVDVAAAVVVLAPYDVLFTGLDAGAEPFGLIVIDEGCWQRATLDRSCLPLEAITCVGLSSGLYAGEESSAAAMADLVGLRAKLASLLGSVGVEPLERRHMMDGPLTAEDCARGASLEESCIREPAIYAGMSRTARLIASGIVRRNEVARRMAALWRTVEGLVRGTAPTHLLRICPPDPDTGSHRIVLHGCQRIVDTLTCIPILHLDATLRAELAEVLLPRLTVTCIEAHHAHQSVTLIAGRFGKSSLCTSPDLPLDEQARRQNRLREVVDHARWQARQFAPQRVLVVTYKAIEAAFQGITGVETAHFNAIAGLDRYGDVGLLIVVGRPLPSTVDLARVSASLFRHFPQGRYEREVRSIHLHDGTAVVSTLAHPDAKAELLRAAICDDEVIQAVGRGRGVNRTAESPLEVEVLADVALPLVYRRVLAWEVARPDIVQGMLLAGIALDSPSDAARVHPKLFASAHVAESSFRRAGFNRQNPIGRSHRGMTVKSAAYRRAGRGRSWQHAAWLADDAHEDVRVRLEAVLGPFAGWTPN